MSGAITLFVITLDYSFAFLGRAARRQSRVDQIYVQGREGKWPEPHPAEVAGGPHLLHDSGGRVPADALQEVRDLVNHHMGQHVTWSAHFLNAIDEHSNVRTLAGYGIRQ